MQRLLVLLRNSPTGELLGREERAKSTKEKCPARKLHHIIGKETGLLLGIGTLGCRRLLISNVLAEVHPTVLTASLRRHGLPGPGREHTGMELPCVLLTTGTKLVAVGGVAIVVVDGSKGVVVSQGLAVET